MSEAEKSDAGFSADDRVAAEFNAVSKPDIIFDTSSYCVYEQMSRHTVRKAIS
jgi:hypothetical protein